MKSWSETRIDRWLNKRIPAKHAYQLNVNNTFILPTRFGWAIVGLMACLFILGTNYQNNVILMFCYFVFALLLLSLFHSYVSFVQFHIRFSPIENVFANQAVQVNIELTYKSNRSSLHSLSTIAVYNKQGLYQYLDDGPNAVAVGNFGRGLHTLKRLSLESIFPFGLFRCWSHLSVPGQFYVFPTPKPCRLLLRQQESDGKPGNQSGLAQTAEELQGIRDYRDSDPIHHVSWKHFAKGQGLLSKDFSKPIAISGWLNLTDYIKDDIEETLSELAYQVIDLTNQEASFGLSLGKQQIMSNNGLKHQQKCLKALSLYSHDENEYPLGKKTEKVD